jgi:iron(III) transport system ATP-binding protein
VTAEVRAQPDGATPGPGALELAGVSRRLGTRKVLSGANLKVAAGESVAVVGRSGSGKTTLLRLVAGLDTPDEGTIALSGKVVSRPGYALAPWRRSIGFVFQAAALWPHMTVAQNVDYALAGKSRRERADRVAGLLSRVGLDGLAERYPDQISGGEARRVALARAMAGDPDFLLLDEALTHVDAELKADLIQLINREVRGRATLLVVTHDSGEAAALADRVVRLTAGIIEA